MVSARYLLVISPEPASGTGRLVAKVGASGAFTYHHRLAGADLFCDDPGVLTLSDAMILGSLFRRHGPPRRVAALDESELVALARTFENQLVSMFWGNYLAIQVRSGVTTISRAPFGTLPVFFAAQGDALILGPDLPTLVEHGGVPAQIDWTSVARIHFRRDLPSEHSAIEGVGELLPGSCLQVRPDGSHTSSTLWSPWDHVEQVEARDSPAERLRRAIQNVTAALASEHARPLLGTSGGLDSSVVAASLATARSDFGCVNLATLSPTGDERDYARLVAAAFERPLVERFYTLDDVDLDRSSAAHLPRPTGWIHELAYQRAVREVAGELAADCFVTGSGGDNVFYNTSSARPLLDVLRSGGGPAAAFRTARTIASVTQTSLPTVAREAWRVRRQARFDYRWRCSPQWLSGDALDLLQGEEATHSWLEGTLSQLPGKVGQVAMLVRMLNHLGGFDPDWKLPTLHPLAAQPVVELCLSFPTWQLLADGVDRRVARTAFAPELPPRVLERRTKGSPEAFVIEILQARAAEVRERLLDGALVRAGIIDRAALERDLAPERVATGEDAPTLTGLLDTEAWLGRWQSGGASGANPP